MANLHRISGKYVLDFARRLFSTKIPHKQRSVHFHWLLRSAGIGCGVYLVGKIYGFRTLTTYAASQPKEVRIL